MKNNSLKENKKENLEGGIAQKKLNNKKQNTIMFIVMGIVEIALVIWTILHIIKTKKVGFGSLFPFLTLGITIWANVMYRSKPGEKVAQVESRNAGMKKIPLDTRKTVYKSKGIILLRIVLFLVPLGLSVLCAFLGPVKYYNDKYTTVKAEVLSVSSKWETTVVENGKSSSSGGKTSISLKYDFNGETISLVKKVGLLTDSMEADIDSVNCYVNAETGEFVSFKDKVTTITGCMVFLALIAMLNFYVLVAKGNTFFYGPQLLMLIGFFTIFPLLGPYNLLIYNDIFIAGLTFSTLGFSMLIGSILVNIFEPSEAKEENNEYDLILANETIVDETEGDKDE